MQHEQLCPTQELQLSNARFCRGMMTKAAAAVMADTASTASVDTGRRLTARLQSLLPLSISQSRFGMASE